MHNFRVALSSAVALITIAISFIVPYVGQARVTEKEDTLLNKGNAVISTEERPAGNRFVKARILINASPETVWSSVHEERKSDPDLAYSRVLSQEKDTLMLEQKFVMLPVIATAICVMSNHEVPLERIDYKLIRSDRFKAMEGSWILTPHNSGRSTILELTSYLDIGAPIPRVLIDNVTARKLERRLSNVKTMAERAERQLAHKIPS